MVRSPATLELGALLGLDTRALRKVDRRELLDLEEVAGAQVVVAVGVPVSMLAGLDGGLGGGRLGSSPIVMVPSNSANGRGPW